MIKSKYAFGNSSGIALITHIHVGMRNLANALSRRRTQLIPNILAPLAGQALAVALSKFGNEDRELARPVPAAPGIHGVRKLTPLGSAVNTSGRVVIFRRAQLTLLLALSI